MIPARNVIDAHAQDLVTNDQLLLPILKTFAKCNHSAHATSNASCLCVVTELSVASNNSNPLFPSIANTPPPLRGHQTRPTSAGIISWSATYRKPLILSRHNDLRMHVFHAISYLNYWHLKTFLITWDDYIKNKNYFFFKFLVSRLLSLCVYCCIAARDTLICSFRLFFLFYHNDSYVWRLDEIRTTTKRTAKKPTKY